MQSVNRMFKRTQFKNQTFAYKFLQISPYFDSPVNNLKFHQIQAPYYNYDHDTEEFNFKVLTEANANYTNEFAEYESKIELVYDD